MPSLFEIGFWGDVENVKNLQRDKQTQTHRCTDRHTKNKTNKQSENFMQPFSSGELKMYWLA